MFLKQLRWILCWLYLFLSNNKNLQIETRPDWITPLSSLSSPVKYQVSASKIRKQTNQTTLYIADSLFHRNEVYWKYVQMPGFLSPWWKKPGHLYIFSISLLFLPFVLRNGMTGTTGWIDTDPHDTSPEAISDLECYGRSYFSYL